MMRMPSRYKSRLRKLEKPGKQIPIMNFIYTDGKTDPDAALEHLGMKREPGELIICLGLLDRDEEPRLVTDTSAQDSLTRSAEGPKNEWG